LKVLSINLRNSAFALTTYSYAEGLETKGKYILKRRDKEKVKNHISRVYIISCMCQPVAQILHKIHVIVLHVRKFCRPTSGLGVGVLLEQSHYSASIERVLVYSTLEAFKYKKRSHSDGHDYSLLNCNIG